MAAHVPKDALDAARHAAAEAELRAHPAPEPCACPGHDLFLALAAVAASYAHEQLAPGQTCESCGYREPRYGAGHVLAIGHDPLICEDCRVSPGQLSAWDGAELAAADGAVVSWGEALGFDEGPAFYLRPWDPA